MGRLLQGAQKFSWREIVACAGELTEEKPLMVKCAKCKTERFFDFVWGGLKRMELGGSGGRCADFLNSPARLELVDVIAKTVLEDLKAGRRPKTQEWAECTDCEAGRIVREARNEALARAQEVGASTKMLSLSNHYSYLDEPLYVNADEMPSVPLSPLPTADEADEGAPSTTETRQTKRARIGSEPTRPQPQQQHARAEFDASCGVLLIHREAVARLVELPRSVIAPALGHAVAVLLSKDAVRFGSRASTQAAAGGVEVNTGLALLMPREAREELMRSERGTRAVALKRMLERKTHGPVVQ